MAHVVGVPKRDPCHKCKLPVFLAERLTVGKKVYHRRCLKCARCGSQLTPGSFYETEIDDQFCCETCPDEEIVNSKLDDGGDNVVLRNGLHSQAESLIAGAVGSTTSSPLQITEETEASKPMRSSIAARLAFFEQNKENSSNVNQDPSKDPFLQRRLSFKNASDEDKSKSLNSSPPAFQTYKRNSAMSSFLYDTVDGNGDVKTEPLEKASSPLARRPLPRSKTLSKDESISDNEDPNLNVVINEKVSEDPKVRNDLKSGLPESPTFTTAIHFGAPRLTASPTFHKPLNVDTSSHPASPNFDSKVNQIPKPLRLSASPTFRVEKDLNLQPSPRLRASPITTNPEIKEKEVNLQPSPRLRASSLTNETDLNEKSFTVHPSPRLRASPLTTNSELEEKPAYFQPSPRSRASPISTDSEHNSGIFATPLFIAEDDDITESTTTTSKTKPDDEELLPTRIVEPDVSKINEVFIDNIHLNKEVVTKEQSAVDDPIESSDHLIAAKAHELQNELKKLTKESLTEKPVHEEAAEEQVELRSRDRKYSNEFEEDKQTIERLSVVRTRLQQFEANAKTNNDTEMPSVSPINDVKPQKEETNENNEEPKTVKEENLLVSSAVGKAPLVESITDEEMKDLNEPEDVKEEEKPAANEPKEEVLPEKESKEEGDDFKEKEQEDIVMSEPTVEAPQPKEEAKPSEEDPLAASGSTKTLVPSDPSTPALKSSISSYPKYLDPFKSDTEEESDQNNKSGKSIHSSTPRSKNNTLNPFDSSDDEIELLKQSNLSSPTSSKVPPPRPPPPRLSRNPFSEETDEENGFSRRSSMTSSLTKKTPIPTPRRNLSKSQNPTPEPTPRLSSKANQSVNDGEHFGSDNSISWGVNNSPMGLNRNSEVRSSSNSLSSSYCGTIRSRKTRRAPLPPNMTNSNSNASRSVVTAKELFPSSETLNSSKASSPSSSTRTSPKSHRKKRPAPAPPKPARLEPHFNNNNNNNNFEENVSKNLYSYPLQSDLDSKYNDENNALLEGKPFRAYRDKTSDTTLSRHGSMRIIPLDASLLDDENFSKSDDFKHKLQLQEEADIVYRRVLVAPKLDTPSHECNPLFITIHNDRQTEKLKDNKEAQNRNRQSQVSDLSADDFENSSYYDKASQGKWKRRKGPAPALPIPPRKVLQMLPLQEIKHELEIIEVQQQGLEKQGVILEKMIRDRCEGANGEPIGVQQTIDGLGKIDVSGSVQNSKEVEDLILQLFELVNEKNELFRRQAELMYLRRQHRLEQEQADLEYEIRVLMAQPERNKTDSDKSREEALITRFVEVVSLRNEVIESLEMDRLREAEEDLELISLKRKFIKKTSSVRKRVKAVKKLMKLWLKSRVKTQNGMYFII